MTTSSFFTVLLLGTLGCGATSTEVQPPAAPFSPVNLKVTGRVNGFALTWEAPPATVEGSVPIESYKINFTACGQTIYLATVDGKVTSFVTTLDDMAAAATKMGVINYSNGVCPSTFALVATNENGSSAESLPAQAIACTPIACIEPLPQNAILPSIISATYTGTNFVTVGEADAGTSTDGFSWTFTPVTYAELWSVVASDSGMLVATEAKGTAYVSNDAGLTWLATSLGTVSQSQDCILAFGLGQFLVIGDQEIATSPNGTDWTVTPRGLNTPNGTVASGNGIFVGTGFVYSGAKESSYLSYSTDGVHWLPASLSQQVNNLVFDGTRFFGFTIEGGVVSSNGMDWTALTPAGGAPDFLWGYFNGMYLGGGSNTQETSFVYSLDGLTWSAGGTFPSNSRILAYGNGRYLFSLGGQLAVGFPPTPAQQ